MSFISFTSIEYFDEISAFDSIDWPINVCVVTAVILLSTENFCPLIKLIFPVAWAKAVEIIAVKNNMDVIFFIIVNWLTANIPSQM